MSSAGRSAPRLFTLALLTGLSVLSLNMFLPSLANIAAEFDSDYAMVSFSVAGYLAITAVLQLLIGPLSDRFGRRPVVLSGLVIFVLSSLGCMLAGDIWSFLGFRVLQGAIISGSVLAFVIIRDSAPEQEASSQMGYVSMAMAVAPMLGPMLGGVLDELFGWRSNFLFFSLMGLATLLLCWFDLGETNRNPSPTFSKQFQTYPELIRSRRYWGYTLCITFSVGAFYLFLAGVPLVAGTALALSPATTGFYLGTITAGFFLGSFLSGRYAMRYPLITMIIAGRIVAACGLTIGLAFFLAGHINAYSLFGATVFVGVGNGLTLPGSNSAALSVRPHLAGSAAGLKGAVTFAGGGILTSIAGLVLSRGGGAQQLLGMMLVCVLLALLAALFVVRINRSESSQLQALSD